MKKFLLPAMALLAGTVAMAQEFSGFRTGNYTGVNGVFFNPASIADSRYRFDFNLFSIHTSAGNNQASFSLKNIGQSFDFDSLKNQVYGNAAGPSSGLLNVTVHGPSLMFNAGKAAIALTTRSRTMANIIDIDGKLLKQLSDDANNNPQLPYSFTSNQNMRLTVNSWTEFGASFGKVITDQGVHFLKGGLSLKYLAGVGNGFVGINNLKATINEDASRQAYLANTTGRIETGFGGVQIADMQLEDFTKMKSTGFGGDIGFVYEFRPDWIDYIDEDFGYMNDRNKYKLKVGAALLDIGSIKYNKDMQRSGAYNIDITGSERLYLSDVEDRNIDDYNAYFKSRPQFFVPAASNAVESYKVSLPTTIQLDIDYRINRGWYASLAAQLPMGSTAEAYNSRQYTSFTLTPRYEGKSFGFYVPFNYNELTSFNAGVSFRLGPLFFGSGSILTAALGNSKQADFHIGLRLSGLRKSSGKKLDWKDEDENKTRAGDL